MRNKIKRYISYLNKFISSSEKKVLLKALKSEISDKGVSHGVKSFLHRKMNAKGNYYKEKRIIRPYVIEKFKKNKIINRVVSDHPKVSVIIPVYNQLNYTIDCIYSIIINSGFDDFEIIIANDNSTEDQSILNKYFTNLSILTNTTNLGFLKNCNNAALQAKGDYLVFLNNDTYVLKNWLSELLDVFRRFDNVGIAGSKLVYPDGHLQEAGGIIWQDGSAWNYGNGGDPSSYEYNYVRETDYVSGASLMISKKLWLEIGGFDELYAPAYCEDSDLCMKVRAKGYKVFYEPCSIVIHYEGATHGKNVNKGVKQHQVVNMQLLAEKWKYEFIKKSPNGVNLFYERDRSSGKKHIMVVDHYLPQIDKDAGSRTISNFLQALLDLGYVVHFLGENQNMEKHYQEYYQQKGIEVLYGHEFDFFNQSWQTYLKEHLNDIDAFLLSRSSACTPVLMFLKNNNYAGKIIYYGHDLGYLRQEKEAKLNNDKNIMRQAMQIKAAEDYMYQNADYALVISKEETEYLKKYITTPLKYVPPYYFEIKPETIPFDKKQGLLFVGGFNHPPNQDAIRWFLDEIYGPIHEQGIKLTIVGSKMPDFIYEYKGQFTLLDIMPDASDEELNDLYARIRIAIVPLRFGAGVKGKVIEAMSKGVPVVGTTVAFEGMPKGEDYIYEGTDTSQEFVDRILQVYHEPELWQQLSWFGKKYVAGNFNKEIMKKTFKEIIG